MPHKNFLPSRGQSLATTTASCMYYARKNKRQLRILPQGMLNDPNTKIVNWIWEYSAHGQKWIPSRVFYLKSWPENSSFDWDGVTGTGFILPETTTTARTIKQKKNETMVFKTVDTKQWRKGRWETNKASPTTAQLTALKEFPSHSAGSGNWSRALAYSLSWGDRAEGLERPRNPVFTG